MSERSLDSLIEKLKTVEGKVIGLKDLPPTIFGVYRLKNLKIQWLNKNNIWVNSRLETYLFFDLEIEVLEDYDYETGQPKPKPFDFATTMFQILFM
jgi:hypothetical protein